MSKFAAFKDRTDNSIASAMHRIGADFQIPIATRRMYAEQDQRDYLLEFDYIGRTGCKMTVVERVKNRIFLNLISTAIKSHSQTPMSSDAVY